MIVELASFHEDGDFYVDIESSDGGYARAAISHARSHRVALKRASKKLQELKDAVDKELERCST